MHGASRPAAALDILCRFRKHRDLAVDVTNEPREPREKYCERNGKSNSLSPVVVTKTLKNCDRRTVSDIALSFPRRRSEIVFRSRRATVRTKQSHLKRRIFPAKRQNILILKLHDENTKKETLFTTRVCDLFYKVLGRRVLHHRNLHHPLLKLEFRSIGKVHSGAAEALHI